MIINITKNSNTENINPYFFSEKTNFINIIKNDIYEGRFHIILKSKDLDTYINKDKHSFEIILEDNFVNGQKCGFKYFLISNKDKIELIFTDNIEGDIHKCSIEAEDIKNNYKIENKKIIESLLKRKILEYGDKLSLTIKSDDVKYNNKPFDGQNNVLISSEYLTYSDAIDIINNNSKLIFLLVEIEKKLLNLKISNINTYYKLICDKRANIDNFFMDLNKNNIVNDTPLKVGADIHRYNYTENELKELLKNIYNNLSEHGGKNKIIKNKYEVDIMSKLSFSSREFHEYSEFLDILELDRYSQHNELSYLKSFKDYENEYIKKITDLSGGIMIYNFHIYDYESLIDQIDDCNLEFIDGVENPYKDDLKNLLKIKKSMEISDNSNIIINNIFTIGSNSNIFYIYKPDLVIINDIVTEKVIEFYNLNDDEKDILNGINIYTLLSTSNYKNF